MAESEPKKIRPPGQVSSRRSFDAEEDPLVELARIVSEDSGYYASRAEKPRVRRDEPIDRNAFSGDLESELLQELESSFTSRRASPPPTSRSSTPIAVEPPADDADDLLRSIEAQLGEFERRAQSSRSARADEPVPESASPQPSADESNTDAEERGAPEAGDESRTPSRSERELPIVEVRAPRDAERTVEKGSPIRTEPRIAQVPAAYPRRIRPAEGQGVGIPAAQRRNTGAAAAPVGESGVSESGNQGRPARPGLAAGSARSWNELGADEEAGTPIRGSAERLASPADLGGGVRATLGGFEEARDAAADDDANVETVDAELTRELEPSYSDPSFGGHWEDVGAENLSDEPQVEEAGRPVVAAPAARAAPTRRRSSRGLLAAASLAVVVAGGAVAYYMRAGPEVPAGPPPVIAPPAGAVKVEPPQQQAEAKSETPGDAVYARVAGNAPAAAPEEHVVESAEEPREVSRIVLPPPEEHPEQALAAAQGEQDTDVAAPQTPAQAAAEPTQPEEPIGPRQVQTFTVRPDGTIVNSGEAPAIPPAAAKPAAAPAQPQQVATAPADTAPIVPKPVQTRNVDGSGEVQVPPPKPPSTPAQPAATAAPAGASQAAQADPPPAPPKPAPAKPPAANAQAEKPAAGTQIAAVEPQQATPPAVAPSAKPAAPAAAAKPRGATNAPVNLLAAAPVRTPAAPARAATPPPTAAAATASGSGFVVQVSSQRSQADAQSSLANLQRQFGSVLGGLPTDIRQVDLGNKGIYYRVRVGGWPSRADAVSLCEKLRAAGGKCIVTQ
jgi:hypothetical protein